MKNLSAIIFFAIFAFFSCSSENGAIKIEGKLSNVRSDYAYLVYQDVTDSVLLADDGNFSYSFMSPNPEFVKLYTTSKSDYVFLLAENGQNITINADAQDLANSAKIDGSEGSLLLQELNQEYTNGVEKIQSLQQTFQLLMQDTTIVDSVRNAKAIEIRDGYLKIADEMLAYTKSYIKENASSLTAISACYQSIDFQNYKPLLLEDADSNIVYFEMVDSALSAAYPTSELVTDFHSRLVNIKMKMQKQKEAEEKRQAALLKIGQDCPEINLPSPDGKNISLSSLKGKYVLLDFWAAWCRPCRAENPNLVKTYEEFNDKGFEIFQVSLDSKKENWIKAIADDKLSWSYHVSDLLMWESDVAKQFGVFQIPMNYLVSPEGKIIARNLRGDQLKKKLQEFLQ